MTSEMTDIEISKALALAIGWKPTQMRVDALGTKLLLQKDDAFFARVFDYRDWNVIGPIAEKYNMFAFKTYYGKWVTSLDQTDQDTPQKAIALAVIGAKK